MEEEQSSHSDEQGPEFSHIDSAMNDSYESSSMQEEEEQQISDEMDVEPSISKKKEKKGKMQCDPLDSEYSESSSISG